MLKYLGILIVGILTSIYYFPIFTTLLPSGLNTKMVIALLGLVIGGWKTLQAKSANIDKTFFVLTIYAIIVSLVCCFSIVYNGTVDTAYASYFISMLVWLSGAYALCNVIKVVHGQSSIVLLTNYLTAVCVCQCILALVIDNVPSVQNLVDTYVINDQEYLGKIGRLYGVGASLDTAGMRFSLVLVMLTSLLLTIQDTIYKKYLWLYITSYVVIVVVGNMMARTTTVGFVISLFYIIFEAKAYRFKIKANVRILWKWLTVVVLVALPYIIYKYNTDVGFYKNIRFAFEGFFALLETGEWEVGSNSQLSRMIVFPDNLKTWIIGDGYFNNPVNVDPYYVGEVTSGYYKNTDIGYLRFIFYMGLTGLITFSIFMCKAAQMAIERFKEYRMMILLLLLVHFIVWLKVSSDCFVIFALLLCIPKEDNDEYNKLVALNNENSL